MYFKVFQFGPSLIIMLGALEHDINDHINRHPELKHDAELLHSIPSIGSTTVAKVLAYAGDVRRFANA